MATYPTQLIWITAGQNWPQTLQGPLTLPPKCRCFGKQLKRLDDPCLPRLITPRWKQSGYVTPTSSRSPQGEEPKWLHNPCLLGVHTWGKNQSAYIAPTLSGCLEWGKITFIANFKGHPQGLHSSLLSWIHNVVRGMKVATQHAPLSRPPRHGEIKLPSCPLPC